MPIELLFEKEKDTPGTRKFKEMTKPDVRGTVGSIYVLKSELSKIGDPNAIKVTIEGVNLSDA